MASASDQPKKPAAIILAAGKGTRMKSDLPKVVHPVGGRPMVCAVVDACLAAGCGRIVAIVGYQQEKVREALASYGPAVEFAVQAEQLGTGHAVRCSESLFAAEKAVVGDAAEVFVLCGDGPLIRPHTLQTILTTHRESKAAATLATAVIENPQGYGRIWRDARGEFRAIVEQKNLTPEQQSIREVNPSYYCFNAGALFGALADVKKNPVSGEYYLTDVLELLLSRGRVVKVVPSVPPEDVLSINTLEDLAEVDRLYRARPRVQVSVGGRS